MLTRARCISPGKGEKGDGGKEGQGGGDRRSVCGEGDGGPPEDGRCATYIDVRTGDLLVWTSVRLENI